MVRAEREVEGSKKPLVEGPGIVEMRFGSQWKNGRTSNPIGDGGSSFRRIQAQWGRARRLRATSAS